MGSKKGQQQQQATQTGQQAVTQNQAGATNLQGQLTGQQAPLQTAVGTLEPGIGAATDLSTTGGITPEQQQAYLRQSTLGTAATYSNIQDQMNRAKALQGGYSPGFDASTAAATRAGAEAIGEAGLKGAAGLTQMQQQGKEVGADLLQKYASMGISGLQQNDILQLQNRAQTGQLTMSDAQLLSSLAAQNKSTFDMIMSGAGAVAGGLTGIGAYKHG